MEKLFNLPIDAERQKKIESEIKTLSIPYNYDTKEYPIDVLLARFGNEEESMNTMFIPSYQRAFAWDGEEISRFIESLFPPHPTQKLFDTKV